MTADFREYAPAAARNREPILAVLAEHLPDEGLVLEIAAGTGEHAAFLSTRLGGRDWQPTEADPARLASIDAHAAADGATGVRRALVLDVTASQWPVDQVGAILNCNMIHIAPWQVCLGLMAGAGRVLQPGGKLFMYGPYRRDGAHTAPSNEAFDASLRARDASWGIRDLEQVVEAAEAQGLELDRVIAMPANNLTVIYRKI